MFLRSRRAFLAGMTAMLANAQNGPGRGQTYSSDARRYLDAATEFPVIRLTNPDYTSLLTAAHNRAMSGKNTLFYSCDRTGRMEIYRCDIRNGQSRLMSAAEKLDPSSLALPPGDRSLYFFDGPVLKQMNISALKDRDVYTPHDAFEHTAGLVLTNDGTRAFFVEKNAGRYRLQTVLLARGIATTVIESEEELSTPLPRPGQSQVLYRQGNTWHLIQHDGKNDRKLALAPGEALTPAWSTDGSTLLYLNISPERGQLNTIRELNIEATTNQLIAKTTQFIAFGTNGDATVFVGASGSKASPHVLILIRSVKRELTMCEHRAKDPRLVNPTFAPASQRIFFVSDFQGKPAIYTMGVERFVEETES